MKSKDWDEPLLRAHRNSIKTADAKQAFDAMVAEAVALSAYETAPAWQGDAAIFKYVDPVSSQRPFAFIINQGDLLFYVRKHGRPLVQGGFAALKQSFATATDGAREEWKVRVTSKADADRLNAFLFGGKGSDRAETMSAKSVISRLIPNTRIRRSILQQLVTSSTKAEAIAPGAWGATLFKDGFRLNVGQVEAFVLRGDVIRLNLIGAVGHNPFIGPNFEAASYESIPEPACALVGSTRDYERQHVRLQEAHMRFVALAAATPSGKPRKGSPFRGSHSEDLMAYAEKELRGRPAKPNETTPDGLPMSATAISATEDDDPLAQMDRAIFARADLTSTEKQALVKARRGQGLFRERVIRLERKCRVTGVSIADHLRASHIKPWKDATDREKLDGNNGLLLAPHIDHLFDRGFISFSDRGQLLISSACPTTVLTAWGLAANLNVGKFRAAQLPFLAYHRAAFGFLDVL